MKILFWIFIIYLLFRVSSVSKLFAPKENPSVPPSREGGEFTDYEEIDDQN